MASLKIVSGKQSKKVKPRRKPKPSKSQKEADATFAELAKAMGGLRTARSSLLRCRAGLLRYSTPDTTHEILDSANYLIGQSHHFCHYAMNLFCVSQWGKEIEYNPLTTDEPAS